MKNNLFKNLAISFLAFVILLVYFTSRYHFHRFSRFETRIQANATLDHKITGQFYWDSGNGFNTVERGGGFEILKGSETVDVGVNLPQLPIRSIKIELNDSADLLQIQSAKMSDTVDGQPRQVDYLNALTKEGSKLQFLNIHLPNVEFKLALFVIQAITAAFSSWLVFLFLRHREKQGHPNWKHTARQVFLSKSRWVFWTCFLISSTWYLLWVLANWPGGYVVDTFSSMHDILTWQFTDWHPYIYALYIMILKQFFNSFGVVTLFQLMVTSAIGSGVFLYAYRRGVNRILLFFFFALFATSIPIAVSNTTVIKDIPFSIAVTLGSVLLYMVQLNREVHKKPLTIPNWFLPLLGLFFAFICQIRHNGIVYYAVIPLLLLGRLKTKDYLKSCLVLVLTYLTVSYVGPYFLNVPKNKTAPYQQFKTTASIMTFYNYFSETRKADIETVEAVTGMPFDQINQLFRSGKWFTLWDSTLLVKNQWNKDQGETPRYNRRFLLHLISGNLPNFLGSRTYEFFHSLGVDSNASDERNDFYENPMQLNGSGIAAPGYLLFQVPIYIPTYFPKLTKFITKIDSASRPFHGLLSPSVIIWNLVTWLALMTLVLFFEKGFCAINLYILVNFAGIAPIFLAGAGESWRYFYFLYLSGILLLPLYAAYLKEKKRMSV